MSKKKYNLNTIYISERLQENLKPISQSAFTAVTAPMGYGKTTAINWYLDKQSKNGNSCVIRISIYSDNLSVFWQSVQLIFVQASTAAMGIDRKLPPVQTQIPGMDLI